MYKLILGLIGGLVGFTFGILTIPIVTRNISFFNTSGQLGSMFSFIWTFLFVMAGFFLGLKLLSK